MVPCWQAIDGVLQSLVWSQYSGIKEEGVNRHPMARRSFSAGKGQVEGPRASGRQCNSACTVGRQKGSPGQREAKGLGMGGAIVKKWSSDESCSELPGGSALACPLPAPSSLQVSYSQGSAQISPGFPWPSYSKNNQNCSHYLPLKTVVKYT